MANSNRLPQMELYWPDWRPLSQPCECEGPAVYMIRLTNGESVTPIPRFLALDNRGILVIGKSDDMNRRRRQFKQAAEGTPGHSEVYLLRLALQFTAFSVRFPAAFCEYRYAAVNDEVAAERAEELVGKAYARRYGEPPPFNHAIPNPYDLEGWRRAGDPGPSGAI